MKDEAFVCVVLNMKRGTFHPASYRMLHLGSGVPIRKDGRVCFELVDYHHDGFESNTQAKELAKRNPEVPFVPEASFPWDGVMHVPSVHWFPVEILPVIIQSIEGMPEEENGRVCSIS